MDTMRTGSAVPAFRFSPFRLALSGAFRSRDQPAGTAVPPHTSAHLRSALALQRSTRTLSLSLSSPRRLEDSTAE
ncbi:hypothetical protein MSAN_00092600 [Mycena sanguinolenta]|uniref:Uncharacterized protein n=1 Tax=Mycena sanguinolenta TaxID=230812 RepID=A0A8H7DLI1_9AGAR|nr:hypothetical protein MSAN_00092600 [Mycena sanguinolenta]